MLFFRQIPAIHIDKANFFLHHKMLSFLIYTVKTFDCLVFLPLWAFCKVSFSVCPRKAGAPQSHILKIASFSLLSFCMGLFLCSKCQSHSVTGRILEWPHDSCSLIFCAILYVSKTFNMMNVL